MIHRAMAGSIERFTAILCEHFAGKWPLWLSPRQAIVLPVAEAHLPYARKVHEELHAAGFFVETDDTDMTLSKKIFNAQEAQHNYILVVGEKEATSNAVAVRTRDQADPKAVQVKQLDVFIAELKAQVAAFK
jgi:threonyl-tRNA synthetase